MPNNLGGKNQIMKKQTAKMMDGLYKMLTSLYLLPRWSAIVTNGGGRYNEITKQALNCFIAFFIAASARQRGEEIDYTLLIKIALYRAFEKSVLGDIRESNINEMIENGWLNQSDVDDFICKNIRESTSEELEKWLKTPKLRETFEYYIYRLATKIATLIEAIELSHEFPSRRATRQKIREIRKEIRDEIKKCVVTLQVSLKDEMHKMMSKRYMNIFIKASSLRNRIRWAKQYRIVPCNVLGHMFEVGIIAFLLGLNKGYTEKEASKFFFIGIFHDFPEAYTGDMPSPVKEGIPGLREATEKLEILRLSENVYKTLPKYMVDELKRVMLEEGANANNKPTIKVADYIAAVWECLRQNLNITYYRDVLEKNIANEEWPAYIMEMITENFKAWIPT